MFTHAEGPPLRIYKHIAAPSYALPSFPYKVVER